MKDVIFLRWKFGIRNHILLMLMYVYVCAINSSNNSRGFVSCCFLVWSFESHIGYIFIRTRSHYTVNSNLFFSRRAQMTLSKASAFV